MRACLAMFRANAYAKLITSVVVSCAVLSVLGVLRAQAAIYEGNDAEIAFQHSGGELWAYNTGYYSGEGTSERTGGWLYPGASPNIDVYFSGVATSRMVGFQGASGTLWDDTYAGLTNTTLPLSGDATPSVADNYGQYAMAYRTASGNLGIDWGSYASEYGLGIAAGTNPSMAKWGKSYVIAFAAAGSNNLYIFYPETGQKEEFGLGIAPGSSPVISSYEGRWGVAFRAIGSGELYTFSPWTGGKEAGLGMAPNTNPSIVPNSVGTWLIAFNALGTDHLWIYSTATGVGKDLGYGVEGGTSPSLTVRGSGYWEIAFKANTNLLWRYSSTAGVVNTGIGMAPGTSPSVDGF